jgi:hypothetical protein
MAIKKKLPISCFITTKLFDGTLRTVYCNCDGIVEGVGKTLVEYYPTYVRAAVITSFGDIFSLDQEIGQKFNPKFGPPNKSPWTWFYDRDMKTPNTKDKADIYYLWDNKWMVSIDNKSWVDLKKLV